MSDGLSFVFQIDSETPGLDDLLGKLDKAGISIAKGGNAMKQIDQGARKASEGAHELGGAFDKLVTHGLEPFLKRAESIAEFEFIREGAEKLLEFPGELADKLLELGEDALMVAAKTERMGRAFENALGKDQGKEAFEYFDAIADKTEFTHEQLRGIGLELAKSGFKGEGLKNAAAAVADLGSMSGNGAAGADEAASALKRIITTGRVEGRALVPFGIHKDEFQKELSEETGLGIKAMQKAMEAGKIPIETTLNSLYKTITNKTGMDLGTVGTEMTNTLESRLTHLKEKPDLFFEAMKDTAGYKDFSDFIGRLGDALNPDSPIGKILTGAVSSAIGELGDTVKGIDLEAVFTEVGDVIKGLPGDIHSAGAFIRDDLMPAAEGLWDIFKGILDTINITLKGLGIAKDLIHDYTPVGAASDALHSSQNRGDKAVDIMKGEGSLPSQGGGVGGFLGKNVPGYSFLEDRVFNPEFWKLRFGSKTKDAGSNDVKGYAEGLKDSTPMATDAMMSFGQDTADALKTAHDQHSPSELFRDIANLDAQGYSLGWKDAIDDGTVSMDALAEPVSSGGGGGGPVTIERVIDHLEIHVDGGGADPYESGRLAVRGAQDEIELVVVQMFERVNKKRGGG